MRKALCCVRQEGLMLSRPSKKLILWDLCQLSRQNPANSLCQRLGMLGKLSEVCLGVFFFFLRKICHRAWSCGLTVYVRVCRSSPDSGSILEEACAAETFLSYLLFPAPRRWEAGLHPFSAWSSWAAKELGERVGAATSTHTHTHDKPLGCAFVKVVIVPRQ